MSADFIRAARYELDTALPCIRESSAQGVISAVSPPLTSVNLPEGRPAIRFPEQLRPHRALDEFGLTGALGELNEAARQKNQSMPEPILITTEGTVLTGYGTWRLAIFEGRREIFCIEYPFSEDESPYGSYSPTIKPGADGMLLSALAWR